ncbi:MAG: ATP synthase F1 subunit gamma [Bdellovibrionales bacterium]
MAKTRALVKRRKAIRNIRKITRTMELIATARFRKAMDRAVEAEAFTRKIGELAADLGKNAANVQHPLLEKRETVKNSVMLVICSNRGLCGGYNGSILREATRAYRALRQDNVNIRLEVAGKRAISFLRFQGIPMDRTYTHFEDKPAFNEVDVLAKEFLADYISGKIDRVDVSYMKFLNMGRQIPIVETLLPLSAISPVLEESKPVPTQASQERPVEYEFLPNAREILEEILPISFKVRLFKCFLDAAVSEQIARRVAMKAATENAGDMIRALSMEYNRARQAQITKEIAEVIGGSEALK